MKKFLGLLIVGMLFCMSSYSQIIEPVKWKVSMQGESNEKEIVFHAYIEDGWHLYATDIPSGGPIPTSFSFDEISNVSLKGDVTPSKRPHEEYSALFDMKLGWYNSTIDFKQTIFIENPDSFKITGYITYQACNDVTCLPPTKHEFSFGESKTPTTTAPVMTPVNLNTNSSSNLTSQKGWQPVVEELRAMSTEKLLQESSLWFIFISGFIGGLLALLTPCVWPMIPLTVSFFLKKQQSRHKAIGEAILYGLSIIIIYVGLGLLITLLFGASALNDLATNALFNILFFALLVLFAVSFFGAFDITLPASWSNKLDRKADTATGIIAIFFMAFTLVLVSFSCTGPIIGTLLVEAASWGGTLAPAVGMGGFAIALAIPFALFAMFPSLMKQLPKSGGWLNTVKVILGFLELALSLKFLSVADLAYGWHILDRETFLVLWIVIFALLRDELLRDEKERAEHVMLVDLARNDMGRISEFGTVKVTQFMEVQNYSHVMHIVSMVEGKKKGEFHPLDLVSSFLPAGTLSGAPKIRAMEIIDELESVRRGLYGGATGYIDFSGDMDFCITIRTMIKKKNRVYLQAGAGIVADSVPENEYQECCNKVMALAKTLIEEENL